MGLTVYYDLDLPGDQPESRARELVVELRAAAVALGAERVTAVRRILRSDCEGLGGEELDLEWLVRCFAERGIEDPRNPERFLTVLPELGYGFGAEIGRCEPVILGLARHPATVADAGVEVPTCLTGWSWRACTKTQYASLVSLSHFVESHRRLIALLDAAQSLGLAVGVRDDSGYWEHRDERQLLDALAHWNALVARIAGRVADGFDASAGEGPGPKLEAPIFRDPHFEHLEAEE